MNMNKIITNITNKQALDIIKFYKYNRKLDPYFTFSYGDCINIKNSYDLLGQTVDYNHNLINFYPKSTFMDKPKADEISILLWNEIMPYNFRASSLEDIRIKAAAYTKHMDLLKPKGVGLSEKETIRYVTANSSSAFLGIQHASKSKYALDSMISTLEAHTTNRLISRQWLIPNLEDAHHYLSVNRDVMNKQYGDLILNAKLSSTSIPNSKIDYRTFVFQNTLNDILEYSLKYDDNKVPYIMNAAIRNSNRAKYRLIFTMSAHFRVIDYLINNGSYDLCKNDGLYAQYTTEGFSNSKVWEQLAIMSNRNDVEMLCLDFKGYDTQISIDDYINISYLLNKHRLTDPYFKKMYSWYFNWLIQPKPIATKIVMNSIVDYHWIIDYQNKFASGLHGTHSFENLYGIATYRQMINQGIDIKRCWFNGDDQNYLINKNHTDKAMKWLESQFNISWDKSLIGHNLSVWSKLWFSEQFHPIWEIGTFRSLFEREGGNVELVESSKFQSNYCKILQVAITLIRLGKRPEVIQRWIDVLCSLTDPVIDSSRIPMSLESFNMISRSTISHLPKPVGLDSARDYLMNIDLPVKLLSNNDTYSVLYNMYMKNNIFSMEPKEIIYYPKNYYIYIDRGIDFSHDESKDIPWMFNNVKSNYHFSNDQLFVRSVLQGSKSYDGISDHQYSFNNMISLAYAINDRNKDYWKSRVGRAI